MYTLPLKLSCWIVSADEWRELSGYCLSHFPSADIVKREKKKVRNVHIKVKTVLLSLSVASPPPAGAMQLACFPLKFSLFQDFL